MILQLNLLRSLAAVFSTTRRPLSAVIGLAREKCVTVVDSGCYKSFNLISTSEFFNDS